MTASFPNALSRRALRKQEDEARRAALNLPERRCFRWYWHGGHHWHWLDHPDPEHPGFWCDGEEDDD